MLFSNTCIWVHLVINHVEKSPDLNYNPLIPLSGLVGNMNRHLFSCTSLANLYDHLAAASHVNVRLLCEHCTCV